MFAGHDPYLVLLSVLVAVMGGYTGFGLAARIRDTAGIVHRRVLLAGAAAFLAIGIWTMHFVGMLAAPISPTAAYLVLPTFVSFLICALVVGISLFFVSIGERSRRRMIASAVLMGSGIVSMHYVGIHGLSGDFHIVHDTRLILLAAAIAVLSAYGGLRVFLARQGGVRLAASATAFGFAVSGMHYTAMYGMHFAPGHMTHLGGTGLIASPQILSLIVALFCFLIAAGFLLSLVPDPRQRRVSAAGGDLRRKQEGVAGSDVLADRPGPRPRSGGYGEDPHDRFPASRVPVDTADGTNFIDVADIRAIRADAHYTLVHDGRRERMCPWSISEAEARLDPTAFMRVHRSHIVSISRIALIRRERDGAVVELDGATPHLAPVSRARVAELKARLGLVRRAPTLRVYETRQKA